MYKFYYPLKSIYKVLVVLVLLFTMFTHTEASVPQLPNTKELMCLVKNVYMEARGEPLAGKIAVAKVTLNRVAHPKYPKTICAVVYEKKQFSWTIKPSKQKMEPEAYFKSMEAAIIALNSTKEFTATHYHNVTVRPNWGLRKVAVIGHHVFYRQA